MGIEPTYLAWKASVLPLNYTRVLQYTFFFSSLRRIGVTGFEPATPCSQSRCSSQTEPHPVVSVCLFDSDNVYYTSFVFTCQHFFYFFIFLFFILSHLSATSVIISYLVSFVNIFFLFLFFLFSLTLKCFLKQNVTKNALLLLHQFP